MGQIRGIHAHMSIVKKMFVKRDCESGNHFVSKFFVNSDKYVITYKIITIFLICL